MAGAKKKNDLDRKWPVTIYRTGTELMKISGIEITDEESVKKATARVRELSIIDSDLRVKLSKKPY